MDAAVPRSAAVRAGQPCQGEPVHHCGWEAPRVKVLGAGERGLVQAELPSCSWWEGTHPREMPQNQPF